MDANAVIMDDSDSSFIYDGPDWYDITTDNEGVKNGTLSEAQGPGTFETLFIGASAIC